ncbi:MAG: glycosyltransferase family 2 protein [Paludibacteraceae bacterium]|nr:glycosyltransferase family 2 protein [Paludibacteraceae bacterium]
MLSILVPIYNHNVTQLISDLHRQATDQFIDFEIIAFEDGSVMHSDQNKAICKKLNCRHIASEKNIGRSASRNLLAREARFEHLLFMDCDAAVCTEHFIEKYLAFCHEECIVIGGTAYDPDEQNPDYSLRLKYGRQREARTAAERSKNNFATFNFLISKNIFSKVKFDESIRGYGHEDMLFGHQLKQLGYEFIQIENPLIHTGLDENKVFIRKTEEATQNLFILFNTNQFPFLSQESALLRKYLSLKKHGLHKLFASLYPFASRLLKRNLYGAKPSLILFDFYKLLFLCHLSLTK